MPGSQAREYKEKETILIRTWMGELRPSILARYNLFSRSFHVNKKCLDLRRYPITYLNTIQYPCLLSRGTSGKTLALMLPLRLSGLQMLTKNILFSIRLAER